VSLRTESALLGALVIDPEALEAVAHVVQTADFTDVRAAAAYAAMLRLHHAGRPVDFVLLADELERSGELKRLGTAFLVSVSSSCPTSLHVDHYARLVAEAGAERRGQPERLPFKGAVRV
jgi:replicative DNA helicase